MLGRRTASTGEHRRAHGAIASDNGASQLCLALNQTLSGHTGRLSDAAEPSHVAQQALLVAARVRDSQLQRITPARCWKKFTS